MKAANDWAAGNEQEARRVTQEAADRLGVAKLFSESYYGWPVEWLSDENRRAFSQLPLTPTFTRPDLVYLAKAESYRLSHDTKHAAALYDSAASAFRAGLARREKPVVLEAELRSNLGYALARLGRKADAIREGRAAKDLVPISRNVLNWKDYPARLAVVYLLVGEPEAALQELEAIWPVPGVAEQKLQALRSDEVYAPLRGNPRFEKLLQEWPRCPTGRWC